MAVTTDDLKVIIDEMKATVIGIRNKMGGGSDEDQMLAIVSNEYRIFRDLTDHYGMDDATAKATVAQWKLGIRTW